MASSDDDHLETKSISSQDNPQPKNFRWKFVLTIVVIIILLFASVVLGYLYYNQLQDNKKLSNELTKLNNNTLLNTPKRPFPNPTPSSPSGNETDKDVEIALLKKEVADLNAKIKRYETKLNEALTYSGAFKFLVDTIIKYQGLNGWQDSDYKAALEKTKATGNQDFVKLQKMPGITLETSLQK